MSRSTAVEQFGHPIQYDPDFNGPCKRRNCTDVLCLLLFIVFIACWIGVALFAFKNGDPDTLLVPKDSAGSRCGMDDHVKDKPYLFFFDLTKCLSPSVPFTGCPTKQVCVAKCPEKTFYWGQLNSSPNDLICDYNVPRTDESVRNGLCAQWYLPSQSFKDRCIPKLDKDSLDEINKFLTNKMNINELETSIKHMKIINQAEQMGQNIIDDLIHCWRELLIGLGIAVLVCLIYIFILRWMATFMVWLSILGVIVLLSLSIYLSANKYIDLKNKPAPEEKSANELQSYLLKKDTWLILLIISSVLLVIILLMLIFLRKRITLAIALVEEGSKAVSYVTSVLFFPIFPWLLQVGLVAFAVFVALNLSTVGKPIYQIKDMDRPCCTGPNTSTYKNNAQCDPDVFRQNCRSCISARCKFIQMDSPPYNAYLHAYNAFGFLWLSFFVTDLGQMILASVFATWYWTWKKVNLPFFAITEATLRVLFYHIGTLAFGSLIIAICRAIRIFLEYADEKLKKYDNEITKAIMCCLKCCFWCLENFLKFINRNAYIMCAIHGKGFCASARDAFSLLMRNILRVFVLDKVTDFLFFLGKLLITIGVGSMAYTVFATDLTKIDVAELNYPLVPVITIMVLTYLVASMFFSVYSMAVDTLFLCFLEDCERNDGSPNKPYFMSKNLMKIFGQKNKTT